MDLQYLIQYRLFIGIIVLCVKPVGLYLYRVFEGERTFLDPLLPVEHRLYRLMRIDARAEMTWQTYAMTLTVFTVIYIVILTLALLLQSVLPGYIAGN